MLCFKCKTEISETPYCPFCGARQTDALKTKHNTKRRGNGQGTVYRRGNTWTVEIRAVTLEEGRVFDRQKKGGFKTKKSALEYLDAIKYGRAVTVDNLKFKALYDAWFPTHKRKVTKSTMNCYQSAMKHFSPIHLYTFGALRTADLQRCVDNCEHGRRTKENMKALGTLLYKFAMSQNMVDKNYAEFIYIKPDESTSERKVISIENVNKIKAAIGTVAYADYIYCIIYTGFRPSEFINLRIEDYHDYYVIGGAKTAAGKRRVVTLSPKVQPYFKKLADGKTSGHIFINKELGRALSYDTFAKIWRNVMDAVGLTGYTPHCARHTFATLMKNVDAPMLDKQRLIGHSSAEMTAHYTHTDYSDLKLITDNL